MTRRTEKVNSLLARTAAAFFAKELPLAGVFVSVTHAEVSPDLKTAKIFVSVFPEDKEKETLFGIREKMGDFKKYLSSKIKMKFMPAFEVEPDNTEKARRHFEALIKKSNN